MVLYLQIPLPADKRVMGSHRKKCNLKTYVRVMKPQNLNDLGRGWGSLQELEILI